MLDLPPVRRHDTWQNDTRHNDTRPTKKAKINIVTLNDEYRLSWPPFMLSMIYAEFRLCSVSLCRYAECLNVKCLYIKCLYAERR
jgi:hypothetical protein